MEKQKSWKSFVVGGVAATAVVASVAAFTLTPNIVSAQDATTQADGQSQRSGVRGRGGERGFGERGDKAEKGADHSQYLAEALGITVDELDAAQAAVAEAAIAQAVEDGTITQEQADRMAERAGDFGGRMPMMGGHGRGGFDKGGVDHEALLADELGITVDELQAAQDQARQAELDQAVADGNLTAEEADLMVAGQALREYIDHEAILAQVLGMTADELEAAHEEGVNIRDLLEEQGLDREAIQDAMQAAHEEAIAQAVADGVITQAQADALENGEGFGGRGGFPGSGGRGGHGMNPGGSERGEGSERGNGESSAPSAPVQGSQT
jgi:hypothetical protein